MRTCGPTLPATTRTSAWPSSEAATRPLRASPRRGRRVEDSPAPIPRTRPSSRWCCRWRRTRRIRSPCNGKPTRRCRRPPASGPEPVQSDRIIHPPGSPHSSSAAAEQRPTIARKLGRTTGDTRRKRWDPDAMGLGSSRRLALPATERETAARKPRHPAASPPELLFDPGRLLVLQASAGNAAVAELIQRAPAAPPVTAHPATAAPTAPLQTGPELLADVAQALTDRYTALTAATAHTTSAAADTGTATDAGAPGGAPRALGISKHVVVGGPAGVATAWPKVEKQILKPAAGRAPMDVLALLYTSAGVHSLAALTKADRSELAAGLNSLLISWASDAHLTGTHADVDVLATDIADSFHASYVGAGPATFRAVVSC